VTIPVCLDQCESTGRNANFDRAAGSDPSPFVGNCYDDSDVYKVLEGAAYALAARPDPALEAKVDALIARIAKAQEADGYLYTIATANRRPMSARWVDERWSHETYCAGHLFEAAVAHHQATGKSTLLDVAIRFADLLVAEFLTGQRPEVPGHQEVELGLVRLYRETGKREYLDLARAFLERRGRAAGRELYGEYAQDHQPLVEQRTAVGHAVRAGYLYTGMADVAAITGESTFDAALDAIWADVVGSKIHLTGGIGAHAQNEGFGAAYELPNESAYNETCAAIANCLWNHRMFLRSGRAAPLDVLERTLYNGMLAGVSLSGDRFFYPNPLACDGVRPFNHGTLGRAPWFGCACCPVNVARFLPSVPGLVYATGADTIWVNLFVSSEATIPLAGQDVRIVQSTEYPWDGVVRFEVDPGTPRRFRLALRIPGWVRGQGLPSGLYGPLEQGVSAGLMWSVIVNDDLLLGPKTANGFVLVEREWKPGDRVQLALPMPVRTTVADERVEANRGRVAFERGPLVYAVEAIDMGGADATVADLFVPDGSDARVTDGAVAIDGLPPGVRAVVIEGRRAVADGDVAARIVAVPYALWANRAVGEMAVWLPRTRAGARPVPPPTVASRATATASHTWASDTTRALNDRRVPSSSGDQTIPRHTWWDRRGSVEWVQYDWPEPVTLDGSEVWFFDDLGGGGGCALPVAWRLLGRQNGAWVPIEADYPVVRDGPSTVGFPPRTVDGLRLEVTLAPDRSGGVLEWGLREKP
jgi:DUF1680 family protein